MIFPNAEFPFEVEIISEDIELKDVSVQVIPPQNIMFQGEGIHSFFINSKKCSYFNNESN